MEQIEALAPLCSSCLDRPLYPLSPLEYSGPSLSRTSLLRCYVTVATPVPLYPVPVHCGYRGSSGPLFTWRPSWLWPPGEWEAHGARLRARMAGWRFQSDLMCTSDIVYLRHHALLWSVNHDFNYNLNVQPQTKLQDAPVDWALRILFQADAET